MEEFDRLEQFSHAAVNERVRRYLGMPPDLSFDAEDIEYAREYRAAMDDLAKAMTTAARCWCHCHN